MSMSPTQQRATLFASGGKRARDIIGKPVGKFTVMAYVGLDASSEYVVLSCPCGGTFKRRRAELSRVAKQDYCVNCKPLAHHARQFCLGLDGRT